MLERGKVTLRSLDCFGIAGQLSAEGEVFYTSLFSTKHLGRVSDLLCARLEKSGVDEFRLRFSVLLSVFEACHGLVSEADGVKLKGATSFAAPLSLECGIDEEKVAIGIAFTLNPSISLNSDGLGERISKGQPHGKLETVLKEIRNHSDLLFIKTDPVARKVEVVALIGLSTPSLSANEVPAPPEVLILNSKTAKETPKPKFYSDLGDLNYPELLKDEGEPSATGHSGEIVKPEGSESAAEKFDPGMTRVRGKKDAAPGSVTVKGASGAGPSEGGLEQTDESSENTEVETEKKSAGIGKKLGRFFGLGKKKKVPQRGEPNQKEEQEEENLGGEDEESAEKNNVRGTREEEAIKRVKGSAQEKEAENLVRGKTERDLKTLVKGAGPEKEAENVVRGQAERDQKTLVKGTVPEKEAETLVRGKAERDQKTLVKGSGSEKEDTTTVRGSQEAEGDKKVKAWSEADGGTTRVRGKADQYDDELVRVSGERQEEEEGPLRVAGGKAKKPSRWRVKASEKEAEEGDTEEAAEIEEKKRKKKGSIFKRAGRVIRNLIGSFGGGAEDSEEELPVPSVQQKPNTPAKSDPVAAQAAVVAEGPGDPGTLEAEAKKLMNELHGGGLDHVLRVAQWEALAIKRDIKNPKASKWVDNLMGSLVSERSRLAEMGKKINISVRLKEMEFKDKLSLLQEEVRKRDTTIAQRTAALARAKDQLTKVNESNEKLKVIAQNSEEDIHYKQKYDMTHKMLELAKEENAKILQRAEELKSQLNANVAANKTSPATASQLTVLQAKYEMLFKQSEEFKKANRQLMERLNEPRRAAAGAEEVRKKIEAAMKMVNIEKQEKYALKNHLVNSHQEQIKLREEIKRLQLENKHLLLATQQARKPPGGSVPPQGTPPKAA